jgi:hypothetical protein
MAAKNQPATTQTTKQQASARVHTSATACRAPSCTIGDVLRLLLLLPHQNASGNARRASELSSHSLFGTLAPSQPSRSHPRPLPARNSALLLISSAALLIGGFVFSWVRPGSDQVVSAISNQTSGRKMFTFTRAIWPRRF